MSCLRHCDFVTLVPPPGSRAEFRNSLLDPRAHFAAAAARLFRSCLDILFHRRISQPVARQALRSAASRTGTIGFSARLNEPGLKPQPRKAAIVAGLKPGASTDFHPMGWIINPSDTRKSICGAATAYLLPNRGLIGRKFCLSGPISRVLAAPALGRRD